MFIFNKPFRRKHSLRFQRIREAHTQPPNTKVSVVRTARFMVERFDDT